MRRVSLLLIIAWLFAPALEGVQRLAWKDLNQWIGPDKRIRVEMKEKLVLVGILEEVQPQSLRVDVRYSSDQRRFARGETNIPYTTISRFAVRKETRKGRKLGMILMLPLAAVGAPAAAQAAGSTAGAVAAGILGAAQMMGLGYLLGLAVDNMWTDVRLEPPPEPESTEQAPAGDAREEVAGGPVIPIDVIALP